MQFLMQAQTQALLGARTAACAAVRFKDGSEIPADLVVMAVGIRPNTAPGRVDAPACRPRHRGQRHHADHHRPAHLRRGRMRRAPGRGLWPGGAAVRAGQGAGEPPGRIGHRPLPGPQTLDQAQGHGHRPVLGRRLQGRRGHRRKSSCATPRRRRLYKKLVLKDDKLVGACLYGDTVDGSWYFKLLREGRSIGRPARPG